LQAWSAAAQRRRSAPSAGTRPSGLGDQLPACPSVVVSGAFGKCCEQLLSDLLRVALHSGVSFEADHPRKRIVTLLAVSVSHIALRSELQLELPLGLPDEKSRPGSRQGAARSADRAMDAIRARFGRDAIGYAIDAIERRRSVPDAFRELAEKDFGRDY
jgi:hypothetical protein